MGSLTAEILNQLARRAGRWARPLGTAKRFGLDPTANGSLAELVDAAERDCLQDRFLRGIVLHTGPTGFTLDERIVAAPISALWES